MFKDRVENPQPPAGVGEWEAMMDKDFGNFTYAAWRRKTEVCCKFEQESTVQPAWQRAHRRFYDEESYG